MLITIQPGLDGTAPEVVVSVYLRPDWKSPGYWMLRIAAHPAGSPTRDPLGVDNYEGLTFVEAGDVIEATLRSIPLR